MQEIPTSVTGQSAIEVAREAALRAGDMLLARFHLAKKITEKGRGNIVTDVDTAVEAEVISLISRNFPDMGVLGEESAGVPADKGYVWVIDPLDGTRNYASGIPFFSVVLGLALDGEVLVGVTYDPMRKEMFHAEKGRGAFLNDEAIRASQKTSIDECLLGMDLSYNNRGAANGLELMLSVWPGMQTARIMGSAALGLSYVAAGRTDLYFHHQLEPWDQIAGLLLVREAGGMVTDRTGVSAGLYSDGVVASSNVLHADFMRRTLGLPWRKPTHKAA